MNRSCWLNISPIGTRTRTTFLFSLTPYILPPHTNSKIPFSYAQTKICLEAQSTCKRPADDVLLTSFHSHHTSSLQKPTRKLDLNNHLLLFWQSPHEEIV